MKYITALLLAALFAAPAAAESDFITSEQEADMILTGLHRCWNDQTLSAPLVLIAKINRDYSIKKVRFEDERDEDRYDSDAHFKSVANKAISAIAKCGPGLFSILPQTRYDEWQEMRIVFDPEIRTLRGLDLSRQKGNTRSVKPVWSDKTVTSDPDAVWSDEWTTAPDRRQPRKF